MLTDTEDVSVNSEAFVCSVEETSGKGTLYNNSAYSGKLLFLQASCWSYKTWKVMEFVISISRPGKS